MTHTKFIPTQFLNTRTEQWQEVDKIYEGRNFLEMEDFVKIIPIKDDIYLIVWDGFDCEPCKTLYKGILE